MKINHLLYGSGAFSGVVFLGHLAVYEAIRGGILFLVVALLFAVPIHGVVTLIQIRLGTGELERDDIGFSFIPSALGVCLLLLAIALGVWTA